MEPREVSTQHSVSPEWERNPKGGDVSFSDDSDGKESA